MSNLRDDFDAARQSVSGKALEELRANYFIQASMSGSDDSSVGGLNINQSGRKNDIVSGKSKSKKLVDDFLLYSDIIDSLEQKYGVDFAENWAAELLDDETYKQLMQIEDQDERRIAIAKAIQDGIKNGTIDPEKVTANPDLEEWLETSNADLQHIAKHADAAADSRYENENSSNIEASLDSVFGNSP